jgi:hypothetical protein
MEKFLYAIAVQHSGSSVALSGADLLRHLENRLRCYHELAASLMDCREAFIASDIDGIMRGVEVQSLLCEEVQRCEAAIQAFCSQHAPAKTNLVDVLSPAELTQAQNIMRQNLAARTRVYQLNSVYGSVIRKAAFNNNILRNLYHTGPIYTDPRSHEMSGGSVGALEAQYG